MNIYFGCSDGKRITERLGAVFSAHWAPNRETVTLELRSTKGQIERIIQIFQLHQPNLFRFARQTVPAYLAEFEISVTAHSRWQTRVTLVRSVL